MTPVRRWCLTLAGLAFTAAMLSACSASDDGTDDVATQSPTTEPGVTTRATSEEGETTVLSVETTPTSATVESTTDETGEGSNRPAAAGGCQVEPVPAAAGLDPFYTQGCRIDGFWVVANDVVDAQAIEQAADTVAPILAADPQLAATLTETGIRLGVIGREQRTTEMPEYRDLNEVFPETDWDTRARGLGATVERPLVSAGEENILCLADDRYLGEDILLHEFSHVLHEFGYATLDPDFDADLFAAYQQAVDRGTWNDTYAGSNHHEYWAEGVQSYFGRNLTAEPADGIHGPIDTRAELEVADAALYALIDQRLGTVELPPQCR